MHRREDSAGITPWLYLTCFFLLKKLSCLSRWKGRWKIKCGFTNRALYLANNSSFSPKGNIDRLTILSELNKSFLHLLLLLSNLVLVSISWMFCWRYHIPPQSCCCSLSFHQKADRLRNCLHHPRQCSCYSRGVKDWCSQGGWVSSQCQRKRKSICNFQKWNHSYKYI